MIRLFRKNQQAFILFTFLYSGIAVFSFYLAHPYTQLLASPFRMPFISGFIRNSGINQHTYLLLALATILLLLIISFYVTRIAINFLIISLRSQFPAIFFLSISSFAFHQEIFSGAIVSSLLLLICIDRLFESVNQKGRSYRFLDSGILLGIAGLFYFNILFLFPFFLVTQMLLRPPSWRELLFVFLGIFLPFLYIFSVYFLQDIPFDKTWDTIFDWVFLRRMLDTNKYLLAGIGFYIVLILLTSIYTIRKFTTDKIIIRKYYQLLFFLFLNLVTIFLLIPSAGMELFYLFAIPASIPLSIYFTGCRNNFFNQLLFIVSLSIPIALNLLY